MQIVFHSFEGRFSDSPRALHEGLLALGAGHEHIWLTDPTHEQGFPDGLETIRYGSPECIAALETADLVIANTHTDLEWAKRPGSTYLQTWHGTPLKRIHWDVLWAPEGRLDRLQRDVDQWDHLISPNAVSTERLRGAFRFEGDLIETGYPRNDVLNAPDREVVRARVRANLGIPEGKTAVLYTPTWRDDVVFAEDGADFVLDLDLDRFEERLGDDHVLLLRLHYMLTGRLAASAHSSVIDVSLHPEVSDLYLAADAMVTDYSSTMFDFAVTGKPMLFFTYDLDDYRDRQRGFYFDFVPEAPGPLLETSDELFDAVRDLDAVAAAHAERYARFQQRYCHLEDGHATERVLDRVLARVPSA
jgi:CDP-glycerol glycerophosphotransferase